MENLLKPSNLVGGNKLNYNSVNYNDFIQSKSLQIKNCGINITDDSLNCSLFKFQKSIVKWALAKGKSAIFADCGLGKTLMQLEWAEQIRKHTSGTILIIAPLAVSKQTKSEGLKFGININICLSQNDVKSDTINITNYERLDKFNASEFIAVVLDESSILKSYSGKIRNQIINMFRNTPYKLACTATPAPNDYMELGNHSEFLGVMTRTEMLSMFFVHDGGQTSKWKLKGHAEDIFWKWISGWSVVVDNPANIGYTDVNYNLPDLNVSQVIVDGKSSLQTNLSLTERRQIRHDSLKSRCQAAANIVNKSDEQWLIWCDLNDEGDLLNKLIDNSINVQGSDDANFKTKSMLDFANRKIKVLITKPKIAGYGMNWQNCHNVIFVGLSDSFESYYQAIRRCWRFGQTFDVNVYIVISAKEGAVKENIERKQEENEKFKNILVAYSKESLNSDTESTYRITTNYNPCVAMDLPKWEEFSNDKC